MLTADLAGCRNESRKLVQAPAGGGSAPSLTARLGELDERAGQLEGAPRRGRRRAGGAGPGRGEPRGRREGAVVLDPVWDALVPREKASLLALLVERVEYDGTEVAITFRGDGTERRAA